MPVAVVVEPSLYRPTVVDGQAVWGLGGRGLFRFFGFRFGLGRSALCRNASASRVSGITAR
ncbi:hypothetical protein GQ85_04265 [Rhodococcus rhodochrous]|nr:hypothetical protein GQ85_04265 [Rhodococcus rhodochrous]